MSPTSLPPEACAAARAVLETPLSEVIRVVTGLPSPKKQTPAQARFVGGTQGKPQHVVTLNHDDTLSDSLEKLARHRILGAPVLIQPDPLHADEMHHDVHYDDSVGRERPVLLGFFDVGDALRALVKALPPDDRRDEGVPASDPGSALSVPTLPKGHRNVLSWMRVLDSVERKVSDTRLISLLGDDAELLFRADADAKGHSLGRVIREGFLNNKSANGAVHRVAIFDASGEIERIVSMSDAVRYLAVNVERLGGMADASLRDLGLAAETAAREKKKKKLIAVPPTTPAIEAFARMCDERVSGVGVLDDRGSLIANLSVSDVRCIQPEHFGILGLPAAEFLALLHGTSYAGFSGAGTPSDVISNPFFAKMNEGGFRKTAPYLVTATPETTFREVLSSFLTHGVHRVYVCEENNKKPVDVVTLTDALRATRDVADAAETGTDGEREEV
jgi:5'-AMP-activated protein kinase regulatory gamma subunit